MQVSFIIPLFNGLRLSQACVASLQASLPDKLDYEVILVDDGSTDGTRDWLKTLHAPFRIVLNETNLGYAKSNNRGAGIAAGTLLVLLNNDLILSRGWLAPMLRLHQRLGPRAGAIGNVQRRVQDRSIDHSGIVINAKAKPEHDHRGYPWPRRQRTAVAVTGACLLITRETFTALGGFDEQFLNGGEDVDLCFRLRERGLINAVAVRSTIRHHVSATPGRKDRDEANSYLLATKWRELLSRLALRAWCWQYLEDEWSGTHTSEKWLEAAQILSHALSLSARPPAAAIRGVHAVMDAEMARWHRLISDRAVS